MKKTFELDGIETEVAIDAYFPIFYRDVMNRDFFDDESRIVSAGDNYMALQIAYAAIRYANEDFTTEYADWLKQYDIATAIDFAVEVVLFMRSTYKTKSQSKKK